MQCNQPNFLTTSPSSGHHHECNVKWGSMINKGHANESKKYEAKKQPLFSNPGGTRFAVQAKDQEIRGKV